MAAHKDLDYDVDAIIIALQQYKIRVKSQLFQYQLESKETTEPEEEKYMDLPVNDVDIELVRLHSEIFDNVPLNDPSQPVAFSNLQHPAEPEKIVWLNEIKEWLKDKWDSGVKVDAKMAFGEELTFGMLCVVRICIRL